MTNFARGKFVAGKGFSEKARAGFAFQRVRF